MVYFMWKDIGDILKTIYLIKHSGPFVKYYSSKFGCEEVVLLDDDRTNEKAM